jgi:hypothetical protein
MVSLAPPPVADELAAFNVPWLLERFVDNPGAVIPATLVPSSATRAGHCAHNGTVATPFAISAVVSA